MPIYRLRDTTATTSEPRRTATGSGGRPDADPLLTEEPLAEAVTNGHAGRLCGERDGYK
jgi:hypothetical protein